MATYTGEWTEIEERDVEYRFERVGALAEEHGVALETESVVGRPARSIVEFAEERDVDGIVMGSHGRDGISRISSAAFEDPSGSSSQSGRYAF